MTERQFSTTQSNDSGPAQAPEALFLPLGFELGLVSAATAIEGRTGPDTQMQTLSPPNGPDDASKSIWDIFAATPGRIADGSTREQGPEHYARWSSDLLLLQQLGVATYRISLSWSSLTSERSEAFLDGYERVVDDLLNSGITPTVTLTHYDMPLAVMAEGGWLIRQTADVFADYAARVARRLADRVPSWVTMNSPLVHTAYGYGLGIEAPGLTMLGSSLQTGAHQLLGHGLAVQALRAAGASSIGIANNHVPVHPATDSGPDREAAAAYFALHNRMFSDPLFGLDFPSELAAFGDPPEFESAADATAVAAGLDFYGVNYYHPMTVAAAPDNASIPFTFADPPTAHLDAFGWPVDAAGLTQVLLDLTERYPDLPPLVVTENGTRTGEGLQDDDRCRFLTDHLAAVSRAITEGADVRGYQHWSLLDGWEFAEGLTHRMGLVEVDPVTRARTPRASFECYRALIRQHRETRS